ncbi:DNA-binding response regulator [Luteitalea sp. TBR-22]|uniref:response regulator transcription factor n=1 Tax=Luteitalea sp. TBR-22 TaxID=2802971 RepID=UPI001AF6940F|nr:response regulator transcription factor [Luteitalea sp. TBR-22]BCS32508.1 DNA-binding response regulator [Luteitalea sp. TBR-22]
MHVLVIEDDPKVGKALKAGLELEGCTAVVSRTGEDGYFRATTEGFDVVILDLGLPGRSGMEVLASVRARGITTPVLILTARDTLEDRVQGLDAGADDFLAKPFAFAELLARLRALRRRGSGEDRHHLRITDLEIDLLARTVARGGVPIDLTAREFELLAYLVRHHGQIVSREMLAREVWKEPSRGTPLDNVIDVHITHLRKKVDRDESARLIHTVRGVGFLVRSGG